MELVARARAHPPATNWGAEEPIPHRGRREVFAAIANPILIAVELIFVKVVGTVITGISDPIFISISLLWISKLWAEVAAIPEPVAVAVQLLSAREPRANIANIAETIPIEVTLIWVGDLWAVIAAAADPVSVWVFKGRALLVDWDTLAERLFAAGPGWTTPICCAGLCAEASASLIEEGEAEVLLTTTLPVLLARRARRERLGRNADIRE